MQKYHNILLNIILVIYSILYQMVILDRFLKYSEAMSAVVISVVMLLSILLLGFRKTLEKKIEKEIKYKTIIIVVLYFLVIYSIGLFSGFERNYYSFHLLLHNIVFPIFTIIGIEIYRYVVVCTKNKTNILLTTIALIIFEVSISLRFSYLLTYKGLFKYTSLIILPIIIRNLVMTYLARVGGYKSTLIYRLLIDTYIYVVPIIPKFSDYMNSMIRICLPILAYMYISKTVDDEMDEKVGKRKLREKVSIINVLLISMLFVIIMLVSGMFTFSIIGVGSDSMNPKIQKGDAVIYRKVKEDEIKKGNILVYKNGKSNMLIIHRLVKIKEKDGIKIYKTKGDANNNVDSVDIKYEDIKGVVVLNIKYLARPTMFFNELVK